MSDIDIVINSDVLSDIALFVGLRSNFRISEFFRFCRLVRFFRVIRFFVSNFGICNL